MGSTEGMNGSSGTAIYQLIVDARSNAQQDRRGETRYPLFRPASILVGDRCFSAFTREISAQSIGLLHNFELALGDVELNILSERGYSARIRTHIHWCRPCGEGWFLSGGRFIGLPTSAS